MQAQDSGVGRRLRSEKRAMKELQDSSQIAATLRANSRRETGWSTVADRSADYGRLRAPGFEVSGSDLTTFSTPVRGQLTVVESGKDIPFFIARIFYIYGATKDCERGAHAHRETWQSFIAIKGNFSLELTDGYLRNTYMLAEPNRVINVPPMIWARLYDFSDDAVCLVLASSLYDPVDYIRQWDDYVSLVSEGPVRPK